MRESTEEYKKVFFCFKDFKRFWNNKISKDVVYVCHQRSNHICAIYIYLPYINIQNYDLMKRNSNILT